MDEAQYRKIETDLKDLPGIMASNSRAAFRIEQQKNALEREIANFEKRTYSEVCRDEKLTNDKLRNAEVARRLDIDAVYAELKRRVAEFDEKLFNHKLEVEGCKMRMKSLELVIELYKIWYDFGG